ncbi:MAG: outer membrane protein assembly factor BamA [Candidatus Aminicenantes bacterium]|nr:MAG: outer membrane protein assembly factor BamA [Candidatus Aminicenantes bacterium]
MSRFERGFNPVNIKKAVFGLSLLCLLLGFLPLESVSQSLSSSPRIAAVSVMVDGQSSGEDMKKLIPIKEGEPFSLNRVSSSIKQIYKTGLFSEIQVVKEGDLDVRLTYLLTRKLFARRIVFQAEEKLPRQKLRVNISSLREGTFFTEEKLEKAAEELKEALIQEGYFQPEIETFTKKDPKSSSFDVFFRIISFKKFVITEISFSGDVILPEDELRIVMKSKEGKRLIPSMLAEDITKLKDVYSANEYQRAEIEVGKVRFDEREGSVSLSLIVIPNERIEIVVEGAKVPLEILRPIWETRIFEDWGVKEGEAKILGHMRKKGYLFASVTSSIEREDNRMRVIHTVTPNEKNKILKISYNGLNYFAPSQLEAELGVRERTPLLKWIDGQRLLDLPEEIEFLYELNGFPDAHVDTNFVRKRNGVEVLFFIQEGNQQKIQRISFEGARSFDSRVLFEQIGSSEGGPFVPLNLQKDMEKLESHYLNQGFRGTEITARIDEAGDDLFSVTFRINEGNKVKIEKIIITGNDTTGRKAILRELRIKEGDYARSNGIRESKRRLERLGIFTSVQIEEISLSPERENVVIKVREGKRNYASLGLGLETATKPEAFGIWDVPWRLRGTAEFIRSNVFGSAGQASLVGQYSLADKRAVLSWDQPYFFGLPVATSWNTWVEQIYRESYTSDGKGMSLTTIKRVSEKVTFLASLKWAETTLIDLQIEPNEVDRQFSPYSVTSITGSFIWDRRDDPINPHRGSFLSLALEKAFPLLEDESNYIKTFIRNQHYVPILSDIFFNMTFRLGFGGGKMNIPIHERFFAGGSNSFRGERFDELGPVDEVSGKPVGGEALLLLNFEVTFPILSALKDLRGTFFYDVGNVFERIEDIALVSMQNAVGFGIRYRTPLGPIRLELGWNLNDPREERKPLVFFTIGNLF